MVSETDMNNWNLRDQLTDEQLIELEIELLRQITMDERKQNMKTNETIVDLAVKGCSKCGSFPVVVTNKGILCHSCMDQEYSNVTSEAEETCDELESAITE